MCLETPKGLDLAEDRENLSLLRSLFNPSSVVQDDAAPTASINDSRQSGGPL
jgi:hypothetical protein